MFMLGMGLSLVSNTNAYLLCYSFCERIDPIMGFYTLFWSCAHNIICNHFISLSNVTFNNSN